MNEGPFARSAFAAAYHIVATHCTWLDHDGVVAVAERAEFEWGGAPGLRYIQVKVTMPDQNLLTA